MADDAQFDAHAADYTDTVQRAIVASGESVQFFADLKVELMARALAIPQPGRILDFGCGIGNTTRSLAARFGRATVTGFDISPGSIAVARQMSDGSDRPRYAAGEGDVLPFGNGVFDAAFTSCVFHHVEPANRLHWAREIRRVLEPGAPLFLFEHNPWNPLTVHVVKSIPFDEGVVLLRPGDTTRLLETAGFSASRPRYYFFFPAGLRALRPLERWLTRIPMGAQYYVVGR